MPLRITKASEAITVEQLIATIYAAPGLGKTTLGFTAEAPLLLDFDKGAYRAGNRGDTVQISTWADVASITAEDLKPYKTLIMDTAGRALDALSSDIIEKNPKMGRGGALTLQGFGELKSRFASFTKLIRSFGLDVVLLVHGDEQKSGDDIIERLDVQGGSKNEIYKVSDLMGRLKIESGKRVLNFSPTDTAFGKNPAGLPKLEVPNFVDSPKFLAGVISDTKAALNKQTAAQVKATAELDAWRARFDQANDVDAFNKLIDEVKSGASDDVRLNAGRLLSKTAKAKGFSFDKKAGKYVAAEAAEAKAEERKAA